MKMHKNRISISSRMSIYFIYITLTLTAIFTILPFYWMIATSMKFDDDIFRMPPSFIPNPLNLSNYPKVFSVMPMALAFFNSFKIASITTFGSLLTTTLAAYAFSKINFNGKKLTFGVLIATIMIPTQVTLIPLYIIFSKIGWIDTHYPLIIPPLLLYAYGVFMIKQFMEGIPDSYIESAKIDGCNHFGIYYKIVLPMCKPAIVTLGLFTFIGHWNNFISPLIFLDTDTKFTVPLIINSFRSIYTVDWGLLMTASSVAILPIIVLYAISQRFFIQGIQLSGLKG